MTVHKTNVLEPALLADKSYGKLRLDSPIVPALLINPFLTATDATDARLDKDGVAQGVIPWLHRLVIVVVLAVVLAGGRAIPFGWILTGMGVLM
jgi:hypothetical protein